MKRTQFTFYESFFQSLQRIRSKEERAEVYDAICTYALYGTEPDLEALSDTAAVAFMLIRPNLDASRRKAESGKTGGSKPKAKSGQAPSEGEDKKEKEYKKEYECEIETEREGEDGCPPAAGNGSARTPDIPSFEQVCEEAGLRGCSELARDFFDYYNAAGWRDLEGRAVLNWRQKLVAWQLRERNKPAREKEDPYANYF